jgi:hypothetical protein
LLKYLYIQNPVVIISFLEGPNFYSSLYKALFFWRRTKLIVGERNYNINKLKFTDILKRLGHFSSTYIVCNSHAQQQKLLPYFGSKTRVIPNGSEIERNDFLKQYNSPLNQQLNLIVPARFIDQKNPLSLLKALTKTKNINVFWYGEVFPDYEIYKQCKEYIEVNNLSYKFYFKPPVKDIYAEMVKYDALILPSKHEGCPNAIIDAMCCVMPILASQVSDNMIYLNDQKELTFNPNSIDEIVSVLNYFKSLSIDARSKIGSVNFQNAKTFFDVNKMVNEYKYLIE